MNRDIHKLLGEAKRRGWTVSRTAAGHWRLSHPAGGGITIATKPTARAWLDVEAQLRRIEGTSMQETIR